MQHLTVAGEERSEKVSGAVIIAAGCERYGIEADSLALPRKVRAFSQARGMAAWMVQDLPSCSLTELARSTRRDLSSLSAIAGRLQVRSARESSLRREKEVIFVQITRCKA